MFIYGEKYLKYYFNIHGLYYNKNRFCKCVCESEPIHKNVLFSAFQSLEVN